MKIAVAGTWYVGLSIVTLLALHNHVVAVDIILRKSPWFRNYFARRIDFAGVLPADYNFETHKEFVSMQPSDVPITYADISALKADFDFKSSTSLKEGLWKFSEWYVYKINSIKNFN